MVFAVVSCPASVSAAICETISSSLRHVRASSDAFERTIYALLNSGNGNEGKREGQSEDAHNVFALLIVLTRLRRLLVNEVLRDAADDLECPAEPDVFPRRHVFDVVREPGWEVLPRRLEDGLPFAA